MYFCFVDECLKIIMRNSLGLSDLSYSHTTKKTHLLKIQIDSSSPMGFDSGKILRGICIHLKLSVHI